jgi:hypothetical protein
MRDVGDESASATMATQASATTACPIERYNGLGSNLPRQIPRSLVGRPEPKSACRASPMTYLVIKAIPILSGVLVVLVSEVARYSPGIGGLITSLPLVAILSVLWLWRDTSDTERIASYTQATFWFVLPSLPMFLALPAMLRHGVGFWASLVVSCILTMALYSATVWLLPRIGVNV